MLFSACVCSLASFSGHTFGWAFLLPGVRTDLGLNASDLSLLWAAAVFTTAPCLLLVGHAIERFGQLRVAGAVTPFWVLSVNLTSRAANAKELGVGIFVMRLLGPGVLCMSAQACIGHWFARRRGLASIIFTCANWLMLAVEPLVSDLVDALSWRGALRRLSAAYVLLLLPALLLLRDQPEQHGVRPDGAMPPARTKRHHRELVDEADPDTLSAPGPLGSTAAAAGGQHAAGSTDGGDATDALDAADAVDPAVAAAANEGLTRGEAVRTAAFRCIMLCHALIEFLWCGAQLFLVDLFGVHGLSPSKVATAQAMGSVAAVVATVTAGLCIDRLSAHGKRWVLVAATASGAAAALALIYCTNMALACAATALLGTMMGPLDVVFATLYADSFGRKHLASILGLVSTLSYIAIGASPVVYGAVRDRSGSFAPLLGSLVLLLPLAAASLALSPPPRASSSRAHAHA